MHSGDFEKLDNCISSILKGNRIDFETDNDGEKDSMGLICNFINSLQKRKLVENYLDKLFLMELCGIDNYIQEKNGCFIDYE
jgi:hypothetical protein